MNKHTMLRWIGAAGLSGALLGCQATDELNNEQDESSRLDIQSALEALPSARVALADHSGVPRFVVGELGALEGEATLVSEKDAAVRNVLEKLAPVFRADADSLAVKGAHTDNEGDRHIRLAQYKDGIEVLGGELMVHVRRGVVIAANGVARADLPASESASIGLDEAVLRAKEASPEILALSVESARIVYRRSEEKLELTYVVRLAGELEDGMPVLDDVMVSAEDGAISGRIPHIHSNKGRRVYSANGGMSLPGSLKRGEGAQASSDATVNTNYDWLGTVYDCYKDLFGRDSYDGKGATMVSTVHYRKNFVNAFWDGTQMVYGDGDGKTASNLAHSMDVTAHELTHAVTTSESNLDYEYESGGLNESMSDVFGAVCEWYRDGRVVSANTWMMGEDVWTPGTPNDALRYMNDPSKDGQSLDHYSQYDNSVDVHFSSGIPNLAFYLLSEGGTHPRGKSNVTVTGIGIEKAAKVFYKANVDLMTSSTNFAGAKAATEQAATQLGYTQDEIESVSKAWQAVGVGTSGGDGGGDGGGGTCQHDKCRTGKKLDSGCDSCVTKICSVDPFCCLGYWDHICVGEVQSICHASCN